MYKAGIENTATREAGSVGRVIKATKGSLASVPISPTSGLRLRAAPCRGSGALPAGHQQHRRGVLRELTGTVVCQ